MTKRVQIYVRQADQPFFDRARAMAGGNLSAAVADAVRHFVHASEQKELLGFRMYYAVCVNGDVHAGVQHDGRWRFLRASEPQSTGLIASFLEVGLYRHVPVCWSHIETTIQAAFKRQPSVQRQTRRVAVDNGIVEWRSDSGIRPIQTTEDALDVARAIFVLMESPMAASISA